jgi:hypothetical protein
MLLEALSEILEYAELRSMGVPWVLNRGVPIR